MTPQKPKVLKTSNKILCFYFCATFLSLFIHLCITLYGSTCVVTELWLELYMKLERNVTQSNNLLNTFRFRHNSSDSTLLLMVVFTHFNPNLVKMAKVLCLTSIYLFFLVVLSFNYLQMKPLPATVSYVHDVSTFCFAVIFKHSTTDIWKLGPGP